MNDSPIHKWHLINLTVIGAVAIFLMSVVSDAYAVLYGLTVGLVNCLLSYGFYCWLAHRQSRYLNQSLVIIVASMIFRFCVVACLLVVAIKQHYFSPPEIMIGFVLGQFFYGFNQLIRIVTNHVT